MLEDLNELDDELRQLFRHRIASRIYLQLKRKPITYTELKDEIGCSDNSLSKRLKQGKQTGVWISDNGYYRLTDKGKDLPDAVSLHAVLQRDKEIEIKGERYQHMDITGGPSIVVGSDGSQGGIKHEQGDDSEDTSSGPLDWYNPNF